MKKSGISFRLMCLTFIVLFLSIPVCSSAESDVDVSVVNGCHSVDAQVPMLAPSEELTNLNAAFLYDYTNETLLYSVNPDLKQSPASLVKIMTALMIAEQGNMDEKVTVSEAVLSTLSSDSMVMYLHPGEIISMRDLLFSTLVGAANEAAAVAADHISGSQEAFIAEMNRYAVELGCTNTNFTNVHGLHDDNQYTTARDMAKILSVAAQNELFMEAFSTGTYQVPATNLSEPRYLVNRNHHMSDDMTIEFLDSRVTGGRAGVTSTGLRNLAVTAERDNVCLVSIVLGTEAEYDEESETVNPYASYKESCTLLDMGFKDYRSVQLFYANQAVHQYPVVNGSSYVTVGVAESFLTLVPDESTNSILEFRYNDQNTVIQAPVNAGDVVSTVEVWCNNVCLAQLDLIALHDVGIQEYVAPEESNTAAETGFPSVLVIVVVIMVLLMILLFGRRLIFRMIRRHKLRRHRKNRRRSR